ncbi:MAG TPA: hypothetical protein VI756_24150, partial [Blastocatellia bacterium]
MKTTTIKKSYATLSLILCLTMAMPGLARGIRPGDSSDSSAKSASEPAAAQPAAQNREILIKNATIMTASHGTINNGSILIRNGKIAEVGPNVTASGPNVQVIDATGKYVTPGIIDCHSHTAIT